MGKKTRKRRKLSLKKQAPRRLENIDQSELGEVSGGYELKSYETSSPTISPTPTLGSFGSYNEPFIIRHTQRCETTGCS